MELCYHFYFKLRWPITFWRMLLLTSPLLLTKNSLTSSSLLLYKFDLFDDNSRFPKVNSTIFGVRCALLQLSLLCSFFTLVFPSVLPNVDSKALALVSFKLLCDLFYTMSHISSQISVIISLIIALIGLPVIRCWDATKLAFSSLSISNYSQCSFINLSQVLSEALVHYSDCYFDINGLFITFSLSLVNKLTFQSSSACFLGPSSICLNDSIFYIRYYFNISMSNHIKIQPFIYQVKYLLDHYVLSQNIQIFCTTCICPVCDKLLLSFINQILQMKKNQSQQKLKKKTGNTQLANQLKARLFDKGFSYGTLPSVKRQIKNPIQTSNKNPTLVVTLGRANSNSQTKIIKQQSSIFKKQSLPKNKFEKIEQHYQYQQPERKISHTGINRVPSAERINQSRVQHSNNVSSSRVELKTSKSAFRIMSSTMQQFNRNQSNQTLNLFNNQPLQRAKTAKGLGSNEQQMRRTRLLMDKISGKNIIQMKNSRPDTAVSKVQPPIQSQKMIKVVQQAQPEFFSERPKKQLDRYIELILKNVAHVDEFVYLKKSKNYQEDPYDLQVIDYGILKKQQKNGLRQYFTISKKGLCYYFENNPRNFQGLNNWLQQRNTFDRIKSLNFFRQFRKWKTLKMWNKTILKEKIATYSMMLKQKLFFLNDNLRQVILNVRQNVNDLSNLRIIGFSSGTSHQQEKTFTLDKFRRLQHRNRQKIKEAIKICSSQCREKVKMGFKKNIDILRSQQKPFSNKNYDQTVKKLPKNYTPSSKQAAYQRLNFPDNMDYQMRSKLRSECMRFIRFSYFLDFLMMSSLKKIYDDSISQFQVQLQIKSQQKQVFLMKEQAREIRSTIEPVFNVQLCLQMVDMPPVKQQKLQPYMPPPTGTHTIVDFRIISHVALKVPKKQGGSKTKISSLQQPDSEYEQITVYKIPQPADLAPVWLQLNPSAQSHYIQIINALSEGLDTLQCFQRWSKHPDMKIYIDVLEEWDDKVSDQISSSDIYLHPDQWIDSAQNQRMRNNIKNIIDTSFQNVYDWTYRLYEKYLKMFWENNRIDFSIFTNDLLADPSDSIQYSIQLLCHQKEIVQKQLPIIFDKQLLRVNAKNLKSILLPFPTQSLNRIFKDLPVYLEHVSNQLNSYLQQNIAKLSEGASNVADFVQQIKTLKKIDKKIGKIKQKVSFIGQVCNIIQANKGIVLIADKEMPKKVRSYHSQLLQSITSLDSSISKVEQSADRNMIRFAEQVSKNLIPNLNKQITKIQSLVGEKKYLTEQILMDKAIEQLESFDQIVKKFEEDSSKYRQYEITLNMPQTRFENLSDLRASLNLRLDMWRGLRDWITLTNKWMGQKFQQIDVQQIKQISQKYTKVVNKCSKKLPLNPILQKFRLLLKTFKDTMPVVIALSNKILQQDEQYWGQIQRIVNRKFVIDSNFTLQNIIEMNFHEYQNQIIDISTQAKQEQVLKVQIQQNKSRWNRLQFIVKQYKADDPRNKQAYVLDKIDDLYAQLDQILANFSGILGNRYLKRQRIQAQELQKSLYHATLIIDDWLVVQKNWIYLQNIFASNDIKVKLRQQNTKFENVDKNFKAHMRQVNRSKLVCKNLGTHEQWIKAKDVLSQIQKQLQKYLEQKRNEFPRFYFLSNDELIQILAKANDIDAIQKNIKKCFQCVGKLNLQGDTRYIQSVSSLQGEIFKINKTNIAAKGQIEQWMKVLEHSMDETLKKNISRAYGQYDKYKNRLEFIEQQKQSQVILVISQINWTLDTQALLQNLGDYYNLLLRQLSQLTAMIRDPNLDSLKRRTLIAHITQDVHNRDIVDSLVQLQNGVSKDDFIWTQQLRFYMEGQMFDTSVVVKQVNAEVSYGYEYLGVMSRLVITPLTDRCWMTIIGAINIKLGAAPAGPAGTGKTQSTKDLAKGLGMLCVVFNCSQQIQYKIMGRLFSGLAQQGAWSCLDQFNRIDIEVLSVIAQQLLTIRVAKLKGDQQFHFIDRTINLKPGCGVFITMNPGYAGRTELPDNLKVLFRSVSMMIPNYRLIAEIMLFAEGFEQAKVLSKKMVQLYKLSSQQLSQQDHYDFGMRAVKSVLVMAGSLKRADKQSSQEEVLIKAMRNSNIPKFLKEDLPLFQALISDLFPHAEIVDSLPKDLQDQIKKSCSILKLQQVPGLTKKTIQLFDTFNVRFGVMIVGQTTSGKTTCYQLLAHSMTSLRKKLMEQNNPIALSRSNYKIVKTHCLNPKAISMGQLYGQVNELTQEWNDGLASSIMRQCTNEEDTVNCMNWVVFDGPVDALWIENMNTVLDDNMMLCLANGERIKLLPSMRMLFEVMDLKVASPATVSRCGMVYMITQQLGWKPQVNSWLDKWLVKMVQIDSPGNVEEQASFWITDMRSFLTSLFEKSIDSMHKFINKKTKQPISTMPLQLSRSLINLFEIFCSVQYGYKPLQQRQYKKKYLTYAFAYAFIWSLCVTSIDKFHQDLSFQCRGTLQQIIYPNNDLVQNFYFDPSDVAFKHWNQKLVPFVYSKQQSFHQIIVQTIDTIRYSSIINLLSTKTKPILITGPSGTGKSIQLSRITHAPLVLTSTTSHYQLQLSVESKLDKLRKNMLGAANGTYCIVAIDDTNMPAQEEYGAIPAIQVLRTIIDKKGVWDRKQRFWKHIQNTAIVCACSPPGGGRNQLTPRFTRHFNVMCLPQPSHSSLMRIYKQILDGFFTANQFYQAIKKSSQNLVNATIQIYTLVKKQKLPIPSKFHYTFNLRDVSKICQGLLQARKSTIRDVQSLGRLWFHQVSRVLKDRLNTDEDHHWLEEKMHDLMEVNFRVRSRQKKIYFSNILKLDTKQYEQLPDLKKVIAVLSEIQDDHNSESDTKLNLVFFNQAVENILKIHRILSMARGNALLIGVSGSGKQSLTRLSSFINGYKVQQIQITKGYNIDSFRLFIKQLMKKCSNSNQSATFLFTDNQIVSQLFLQDINNILNSGEIPNLWELQQWQDIINTTRPFNAALKRPESRENIYRTFVQRVRQRLHVVLSMSPIGDALRIRCRKFPALVNCCTINWFFPWPEEALINVASAILDGYDRFPTYQNIPKRNQVIQAFADICKEVHLSANAEASKFELALKRKVYTTPKSYLDMLKLYLILLQKKQNQIFEKRDRLAGGLDKLQQASVQVADLDVKLKKLQPQLQMQNVVLEKALVKVKQDSEKARQIEAVVSAEAEQVAKQKNDVQILADEARDRLKEVQPQLERAKKAVQTIDRKALQTVRSFVKPPAAVQIVMEGVCILFGIKGDWDVQKKLLIKLDDFISSLKNYDKDKIPEDRLLKLRKQLQKSQFKEEVLFKKARQVMEIAQWCKAIQKYAVVAKQIEPKKKKMAELQLKLQKANKDLEQKMKVLNQAQQKVQQLKNETQVMIVRKKDLERQLKLTKDRLVRAADLIRLTKDEAIRWKQTVEGMKDLAICVPTDVFLCSAAISYNGPFTGSYRKSLLDYWTTLINAKDLPLSQDFQITKTLGDPLVIRDWIIDGLPSDTTSLENAIFAVQGNRWPLMIDPQSQATKWMMNMLSKDKKTVTKLTSSSFQQDMKSSIKNGVPVLIFDIQNTLPAVLDSVFAKQIKVVDNMPMIKFAEQTIYYDDKFKLFMFTKAANPNFLPEIFIRVNIINFTVTFEGLQQQLLATVVKHQKEEIQIQRDENIVKMGQYKKKINQSQLNILRLLQKAKAETILDNTELIDTLQSSQQASAQIKDKIVESQNLQQIINKVRSEYEPVSTRGSVLFFVIKDLSLIDSMYQYSLQYIQKIFNIAMDTAQKNAQLEKRLTNLIQNITKDIYKNVTRGLFEKDKILFSFMIAASINRQSRVISQQLWSIFAKGPAPSDKQNYVPNPSKKLFSERSWEMANYVENNFAKFTGLTQSFTSKLKLWETYNDSNKAQLPDQWDKKLDLFEKLIIQRIVRPQRIGFGMANYIIKTIGQKYLEAPNVSMRDLWKDSDNRTPIIFVLSPGADPTASLLKFKSQLIKNGNNVDLEIISLGQGQGGPAQQMINRGKLSGKWVLLQNCHLAKTFMPLLQKIVEQNLNPTEQIMQSFRLYLTSMPTSYFPSSVLQNGIKLTTQPPKGLKANLKRSWNQIDEDQLSMCPQKSQTYHKMLWGLTFFHAIIQERQKFGPLGWNIKYQFNESDLETSKTVLQMLLNKADSVPFQALQFVTGEINYGGRVTDDWDRRCLLTILRKFYNPSILETKYKFSNSPDYYIPEYQNLENYRSYIETLPLQQNTVVFGMHQNANVTYLKQQQKKIMQTLLILQPREASGGGKSSQQIILEIVSGILERKQVPQPLDINSGHKVLFERNQKGLLPSLTTFLLQQIFRFNRLLKVIKATLQDLKKAIRGLILMSDDLDAMFYDLLVNKVPKNWAKVAYPCLKPLGSWLKDLRERVQFIKAWLEQGSTNSYWISSFFFPQGFLTGVLQEHARQPDKQIPIDELVFSFKFTQITSKEACTSKPAEGIYVSGLILEGGSWDIKKKLLIQPQKNQMYCFMPYVNFIPIRFDQKRYSDKFEIYECPVYKTSVRAGVLSTTGQSTNFVLTVQMPSVEDSDNWVLQGTALLLQLNQ